MCFSNLNLNFIMFINYCHALIYERHICLVLSVFIRNILMKIDFLCYKLNP